ncbi:hypothetical protein D3C76_738640 [compost metagenome]
MPRQVHQHPPTLSMQAEQASPVPFAKHVATDRQRLLVVVLTQLLKRGQFIVRQRVIYHGTQLPPVGLRDPLAAQGTCTFTQQVGFGQYSKVGPVGRPEALDLLAIKRCEVQRPQVLLHHAAKHADFITLIVERRVRPLPIEASAQVQLIGSILEVHIEPLYHQLGKHQRLLRWPAVLPPRKTAAAGAFRVELVPPDKPRVHVMTGVLVDDLLRVPARQQVGIRVITQHFIGQPQQRDHSICNLEATSGLFFNIAHGPPQTTPKGDILVFPWRE